MNFLNGVRINKKNINQKRKKNLKNPKSKIKKEKNKEIK